MMLATIAITSGVLQVWGYVVYISKSLKNDIEPNATTWFMFAYGTLILAVLEWDRGASWTLLILPVSCASLAMVVAFLCWKKNTLHWPKHKIDVASFFTDVVLTIMYILSWIFLYNDLINSQERDFVALIFVICSNLTTFTAFTPILRESLSDPVREHTTPWKIWTCAYIMLAVATYIEVGFWSELMIYPLMNAFLHGLVGWLTRAKRKAKFKKILST